MAQASDESKQPCAIARFQTMNLSRADPHGLCELPHTEFIHPDVINQFDRGCRDPGFRQAGARPRLPLWLRNGLRLLWNSDGRHGDLPRGKGNPLLDLIY